MLNMGKGAPLNIEFYSGTTSEGKKKTIAKCNVEIVNIPYALRETFLNLYCEDAFSTVELSASAVCSNGDKYNEALGKKIARKKLLSKYFNLIACLTRYDIDSLTSRINSLYADIYEISNIQARLQDRINYMKVYGEPYEE